MAERHSDILQRHRGKEYGSSVEMPVVGMSVDDGNIDAEVENDDDLLLVQLLRCHLPMLHSFVSHLNEWLRKCSADVHRP